MNEKRTTARTQKADAPYNPKSKAAIEKTSLLRTLEFWHGWQTGAMSKCELAPLRSGETSAGLTMFAVKAARSASHREVASTRSR